MDAIQAQALLDRMGPVPECSVCGMRNPPTEVVQYQFCTEPGRDLVIHQDCPRRGCGYMPEVGAGFTTLLSEEEVRDALTTIIRLYAGQTPTP